MEIIPVDASDFSAALRLGPCLETSFVDVIATGSRTPYNFLLCCVKRIETDGAIVMVERFPVGRVLFIRFRILRWNRRLSEYLTEL